MSGCPPQITTEQHGRRQVNSRVIHCEMSPAHKVLISSLTYMFCRRVKHILACRDTRRYVLTLEYPAFSQLQLSTVCGKQLLPLIFMRSRQDHKMNQHTWDQVQVRSESGVSYRHLPVAIVREKSTYGNLMQVRDLHHQQKGKLPGARQQRQEILYLQESRHTKSISMAAHTETIEMDPYISEFPFM